MGILPPFHFSISNPVRTVLMLWNNLMLTSECSCGLLDSVKSKLSSYKLPRLSISLRMTDRKSFKKTKSARNWVGYFIWQMSWKYPAYHSHLNDIIEKRQAATFNVSNWAIKIWSLQGENIFIELWRRRRRRSGGVGWRQLFHCHGNIWHLNLHDVHIINHVALSLETFQIWNPTRRWAFTPDICIMKTSVRYKLKHLRYQHEAKKTKHLSHWQLKYSACNLTFILLLFMYLKMRQTVQLHHSAGDQSQLRYLTRTPLGWRTGSLWAASSCQSAYRQLLLSDGDSIQKKCGVIGLWDILARAVVGQSTSRPVVTTVTPFPVLVNS